MWPDADEAALTVEALTERIRKANIVVDDGLAGILTQAIAAHRNHHDRTEIIVAQTVEPTHGEDGTVDWQPGCDPVHQAAASSDGGSKIDYYNQTHYIAVKSGTLLATVRAPGAGTDGRDIYDKPRKAKSGAPTQLRTDASVTLAEDGRLTANIDGIVHFENNLLKIMPLFEVAGSVDFSTGNVAFTGSVVVRGDVRDRFVVRADQDVTVYGLVGAATVICGRNLHIHCGMAAHDRGCLYAGGDAQVGYLKNVHGLVKGILMARRELINCEMAIGQNFICDAGAVIGGCITVAGTALIGTLGSAKETPTTIAFGSHPCQQETGHSVACATATCNPAARAAMDAASLAHVTAQIRACANESAEFVAGSARPVNLTVAKFLHAGAIVKTGRVRVAIIKSLRGPVQIHGDSQTGLYYKLGDGVSHPLSELAQPLNKAG